MELISYDDFSKLRLIDFVPAGQGVKSAWGTEAYIGFSDGEFYRFCYFLWDVDWPRQVSEIRIESFADDVRSTSLEILRAMELPLLPGMTVDRVLGLCGNDVAQLRSVEHLTFAHFILGDRHPYHIHCTFQGDTGLSGVIVVRGDCAKFGLVSQAK